MTTPSASVYKSPLHEMTQTTPTCLWNDSASISELKYSLEHGAVGATCNPVIVVGVLKKEFDAWKGRIQSLANEFPTATEGEIAWQVVREMSANAAALLQADFREAERQERPPFDPDRPAALSQHRRDREAGARLQSPRAKHDREDSGDARRHPRDRRSDVSRRQHQCDGFVHVCRSALPSPKRWSAALKRREKEGLPIDTMGPVCTIMVGRLDDWLKVVAEKENISIDPGYLEWAGVAVFKKTYQMFRERGYRLRLLSAAFRNHMHWSEFIGGDVVISPPYAWQVRFNASDIEVKPRMENPVDPKIVDELYKRFPDFRRAYTKAD